LSTRIGGSAGRIQYTAIDERKSPMKFRLLGLLMLCCALVLGLCLTGFERGYSQTKKKATPTVKATPTNNLTPSLNEVEQALLNEINDARAHPQIYATYLEKMKPLFSGKEYRAEGQEPLTTQEGWAAVEDAIKFMKAAKPLGPLSASQGLCLAAFTHVKDQSATGSTGHAGSNKAMVEQRVKPFGSWQGDIGENLTYGNESARERLLTWLIDDGVASRGHRTRLMSSSYKVAGISCGPHPEYGTMCVVTLAGAFTDSKLAQSTPIDNKSADKNRPPAAAISVSVPQSSNANAKSTNSGSTTNSTKKPRQY
jgi:uncharacterized protein YkwD